LPLASRLRSLVSRITSEAKSVLTERSVRRRLAEANREAGKGFDCVLYFADGPDSVYQVRQWLAPMAKLAERHRVAVLVHRPTTATELLRGSPLPVFLTKGIGEVEAFINHAGARMVFYVNNNRDNFTVLRLPGQVHVHLSHGESEKVSMVSNQLKAYDFAFIAGPASRERILAALQRFDESHLVEVGRPQLDFTAPAPPTKNEVGRVTVLYAPTWEGDRPAMAYGSVASHGREIVASVLADPRYRLVFRPHPRTGSRLAAHRVALKEIGVMIAAAEKSAPAGHRVDTSADFSAAMAEADVCICDISAMALDWLPRSKPLLMTRPSHAGVHLDPQGAAGKSRLIDQSEASQTPALLAEATAAGIRPEQLELIVHHFGDASPGASTARFIAAVDKILAEQAES
jgi:hypothetical protein